MIEIAKFIVVDTHHATPVALATTKITTTHTSGESIFKLMVKNSFEEHIDRLKTLGKI